MDHPLRSARIEAALERALAGAPSELLALLDRSSGLPGPRPNLDLARSAGAAIARGGARSAGVIAALCASQGDYHPIVAAQALAARHLAGDRGAGGALQELAGDSRQVVRAGVVEALRTVLAARGDAAVVELSAWTDGYLQAHVALEAISERAVLTQLGAAEEVVARLAEAFDLADRSPRAAERSQGVRQLRQGLPAQIAAVAARFPAALTWLEARTATSRPESREVIAGAIAALRRGAFPTAQTDRLAAALAASAPPDRDAARVVHGTRKRSKGRR